MMNEAGNITTGKPGYLAKGDNPIHLETEECNLNESQSPSSPSITTTDEEEELLVRLASKVKLPVIRYELSILEQLRYEAFAEKHKNCIGPLEVSFSSTGIGNVVKLRCGGCDAVKDITDVGSW